MNSGVSLGGTVSQIHIRSQAWQSSSVEVRSSGLVFQVVPSTRSAEDLATPIAPDVRAEVFQQAGTAAIRSPWLLSRLNAFGCFREVARTGAQHFQDDSTFDSLELYYRESKSRPAEMRRRDVKASFALNRYYAPRLSASDGSCGQLAGDMDCG